MYRKIIQLVCLFSLVAISTTTFAASRSKNKIGISYGILSDPAPSITAWQLKYNLTPVLQLGLGYGSILGVVKNYGLNAKIFVIPSWNLSPYVNVGYGYMKVTGDFTISSKTVTTASGSLNSIYGGAGIDHQANIGFNIGGGINYIFSPTIITDSIKTLSHFYIGWVF